VKRILLDQVAIEIQLTEKLLEDRAIVILTRRVAGLSDRRTQGSGVQHHPGNER